MIIKIPQYIIKNSFVSGNNIFQLGFEGLNEEVDLDECEDGYLLKTILDEDILITNQNRRFKNYKYILKYKDSELNERTELKWFRYVQDESIQEIKEMYESNYKIKKEIVENDNIIRVGLRTPQVGAIHAILSNITNPKYKEGIVVMPTGTGKTEVMLTTFLSEEIKRLIVITPSNALREQIGNKFKQLGSVDLLKNGNEKYSFGNLFKLCIEQKQKKGLNLDYLRKATQMCEKYLLPSLAKRDVKTISYSDLLTILNAIYNPNNPATSRLDTIRRLINFLHETFSLLYPYRKFLCAFGIYKDTKLFWIAYDLYISFVLRFKHSYIFVAQISFCHICHSFSL